MNLDMKSAAAAAAASSLSISDRTHASEGRPTDLVLHGTIGDEGHDVFTTLTELKPLQNAYQPNNYDPSYVQYTSKLALNIGIRSRSIIITYYTKHHSLIE